MFLCYAKNLPIHALYGCIKHVFIIIQSIGYAFKKSSSTAILIHDSAVDVLKGYNDAVKLDHKNNRNQS